MTDDERSNFASASWMQNMAGLQYWALWAGDMRESMLHSNIPIPSLNASSNFMEDAQSYALKNYPSFIVCGIDGSNNFIIFFLKIILCFSF